VSSLRGSLQCELLISDEAWNVFTREDAAVIVLAAIAHDLGMLIDIEGFRYLLDNNLENKSPLGPNNPPWQELWREFQLEARRFDGTKLVNIVGSEDPISSHELEFSNLTDRGIVVLELSASS